MDNPNQPSAVGLLTLIRRFFEERSGYSLMELVMVILLAATALPGIMAMYSSVYINGTNAELMTVANALAIQQMETILADKAGSGAGYGYDNINTAKYASVNPPSPFTAWGRTVTVTSFDIEDNADYEAKQIVVRVTHPRIPDVVLTTWITDHSAL